MTTIEQQQPQQHFFEQQPKVNITINVNNIGLVGLGKPPVKGGFAVTSAKSPVTIDSAVTQRRLLHGTAGSNNGVSTFARAQSPNVGPSSSQSLTMSPRISQFQSSINRQVQQASSSQTKLKTLGMVRQHPLLSLKRDLSESGRDNNTQHAAPSTVPLIYKASSSSHNLDAGHRHHGASAHATGAPTLAELAGIAPSVDRAQQSSLNQMVISAQQLTAAQNINSPSTTTTIPKTKKQTYETCFEKTACLYEDRAESTILDPMTAENESITQIIGFLSLCVGGLFFVVTFFCVFGAKFLAGNAATDVDGQSQHMLLKFLATDDFYCFLVPLSIPVTVIFIYANWVAMKFFRHA